MQNTKEHSIALFIDADNTSYKYGKLIMDILQAEGNVFIRRIYGNWQKNLLHSWNDNILLYGMNAIQQMDFVVGKNASDMLITIDAMDILHRNMADTFAIASSDSDFTPLVMRLRESGIRVIGLGREQSSQVFQHACNKFVYLDRLLDEEKHPGPAADEPSAPSKKAAPATKSRTKSAAQSKTKTATKAQTSAKSQTAAKTKSHPDPVLQSKEDRIHNFLQKMSEQHGDDNGFVSLGQAGKILKNELGFSTKEVGFSTLSKFLMNFSKRYEVTGIGASGRPGTSKFRCR